MSHLNLFAMQKELDARIAYKGTDRLLHKFTALWVETAEALNETRDFKFWSTKYKQPNTKAVLVPAMMEEDKQYYNPLLHELSDMHHFIMSIGLELQEQFLITLVREYEGPDVIGGDISQRFRDFDRTVRDLEKMVHGLCPLDERQIIDKYEDVMCDFLAIVETLGFTWDDLEQAYMEKNAINHQRQQQGY
ncbi:dUTP diphosphatase [Ectobacillus ponti]|uniref:dUTP diphosphatase n=1 Tax=Ectobacillus ponti TaxID=2961894 RepID=A0AA41X838_9BACI|nr:dUTP diphosphatase [Ectobacillus ponti]MCP8970547.1 dUTP diphosphatase [Ectobacillus ponti]